MKIHKNFISILVFIFMMCLLTSFVFASQNSGTFSQTNGGAVDLNFEWGGNLTNQSYENAYVFTGGIGRNANVVCDIDKDGIQEIISVDGDTIYIRALDEFNDLIIEESFIVTPQGATNSQINSIACVRLRGDFQDDNILIIHQGNNQFSNDVEINDNDLLFIERQSQQADVLSQNITYGIGNNYYLVGYKSNVSQIQYGEITCDGYTSGGVEETFECIFGTATQISYFILPTIFDFTCADCLDTLDISGLKLVKDEGAFDIIDTAWQPQHYQISVDSSGVKSYIHIYQKSVTSDFSVSAYQVTGSFPVINWALENTWSNVDKFVSPGHLTRRTTDTPNEDLLCLATRGVIGFASQYVMHTCATNDGAFANDVYTRVIGDGTERGILGNAYFDNAGSGLNQRYMYIPRQQGFFDELMLHNNSALVITSANFPTLNCDFREQSIGSDCPTGMIVSRYALDNDAVLIIIGNEFVLFDEADSSIIYLNGSFPHSIDSEIRAIDLDNDFQYELMARDIITGETYVYTQIPSIIPITPPVNLINTSKIGDGYFGWYGGNNCVGLVEFKATECIGVDTDCTYNATNSLSQETLSSTCGGIQVLTDGLISYASPRIFCDMPVGEFNVTLQMKSTEKAGNYAITSPPIPLKVINGTPGFDCNVLGEYYGSPDDVPTLEELAGGGTGTGTGGVVVAVDDIGGFLPTIFGNGFTTSKLIIGVIMVISITIMVGQRVKSGFVVLLSAVLATLLATLLGLIPSFLIIMIFAVGLLFFLISKIGGTGGTQ